MQGGGIGRPPGEQVDHPEAARAEACAKSEVQAWRKTAAMTVQRETQPVAVTRRVVTLAGVPAIRPGASGCRANYRQDAAVLHCALAPRSRD